MGIFEKGNLINGVHHFSSEGRIMFVMLEFLENPNSLMLERLSLIVADFE